MSTFISRADFLKALAGLTLVGMGLKSREYFVTQPSSKILGPSRELGHLLRDPKALAKIRENATANSALEHKKVVVIGAGIAGLSAGWWLKKNGFDDFIILELESEVGGNSRSGKNAYGAYPWGAHYVPIANKDSVYVRQLFEELGIITGYKGELPVYDELMLCHEPQDRLFKDGAFHEGLVPKRGLQPEDSADIARFFKEIAQLRSARGGDGKEAFTIPLDHSSQDARYLELDKISMAGWLNREGYKSRALLWYVNYCCRDDYGASLENVSAWAGLHYFAGRKGLAANAEQNSVLTWPEGNGYLVGRLKQLLSDHIRTDCLASLLEEGNDGLTIYFKNGRIICSRAILAVPRFVAARLLPALKGSEANLNYAPWLTANISLKQLPEARGVALAWDNVGYLSKSLGYVVANHQDITTRQKPLVITYYYPLSEYSPRKAREKLYMANASDWTGEIVADLEVMHPGIREQIINIDIWPWGHGMISPGVDFIWGTRRNLKNSVGAVQLAHSDMSGISNFEEAQYQGVEAARRLLSSLKSDEGQCKL